MPHDLQNCYQILELAPGATSQEVKLSYRRLVKVWHPDRFSGNRELERTAQEKLTSINLAYGCIRSQKTHPFWRGAPRIAWLRRKEKHDLRLSGSQDPPNCGADSREHFRRRSWQAPPASAPGKRWRGRFFQVAGAVAAGVMVKAMFFTEDWSNPKSDSRKYAFLQSLDTQKDPSSKSNAGTGEMAPQGKRVKPKPPQTVTGEIKVHFAIGLPGLRP